MEIYSPAVSEHLKALAREARGWIRSKIYHDGAGADGNARCMREIVDDIGSPSSFGSLGGRLFDLAWSAAELVYSETFSSDTLQEKRQNFADSCKLCPIEVTEHLWFNTQRFLMAAARLECVVRMSEEEAQRCRDEFEAATCLCTGNDDATRPPELGGAFGSSDRITYVTDVEGHWTYFCNYVDLASGIRFATAGDHRQARQAADLELELRDGWHFVFGGDACDKGPGTLRFLEAMVRFKWKYPSRVHLLLGNRDINKMRWTAELHEAELSRYKAVPAAYWVGEKARKRYAQFLTDLAAHEEGLSEEDVTDDMLRDRSTKANKLRYMLKCDMGSDGEFEFRRQELAHILDKPLEDVSDDAVVESYEAQLRPGGWMREYLREAKLGVILGECLFVHGQIIGNQFPPGQVRGADSDSTASCVGVVPDRPEKLEDVHEWLGELNAWYEREFEDWERRPLWEQPPTEETYESWSRRGGAGVIAYGCPGCRVPTVVYCRWLTPKGMPLKYPDELIQQLIAAGLRYVVVGHTPHGNLPTVIPNDGVMVVMADTSFSQLMANSAFPGDNRGTAVSEVEFAGGRCTVRGLTEEEQIVDYMVEPEDCDEAPPRSKKMFRMSSTNKERDPFVGKMNTRLGEKKFFVKARLPPAPGLPDAHYLLTSIDGFRYDYAMLRPEEVAAGLSGPLNMPVVKRTLSSSGVLFGHSFEGTDADHVLAYLFAELDRDGDGMVVKKELMTALTDKLTRDALLWSFPGMSIDEIIRVMDKDHDGGISLAELRRAIDGARAQHKLVDRGGICFRMACGSVAGAAPSPSSSSEAAADFPHTLGPFALRPTRRIRPRDLRIGQRSVRSQDDADLECEVSTESLQAGALEDVLRLLPDLGAGQPMRSFVTPAMPASLFHLEAAGMPAETRHIAWCYPFVRDWVRKSSEAICEFGSEAFDPDLSLLWYGAFIGFGDDLQVPTSIMSLTPAADGGAEAGGVVNFASPEIMAPAALYKIAREGRLHPVTFRHMVEAGATDFCWIGPSEGLTDPGTESEEVAACWRSGFFVYVGDRRLL